jgi:hypothetical protein
MCALSGKHATRRRPSRARPAPTRARPRALPTFRAVSIARRVHTASRAAFSPSSVPPVGTRRARAWPRWPVALSVRRARRVRAQASWRRRQIAARVISARRALFLARITRARPAHLAIAMISRKRPTVRAVRPDSRARPPRRRFGARQSFVHPVAIALLVRRPRRNFPVCPARGRTCRGSLVRGNAMHVQRLFIARAAPRPSRVHAALDFSVRRIRARRTRSPARQARGRRQLLSPRPPNAQHVRLASIARRACRRPLIVRPARFPTRRAHRARARARLSPRA